MCVVATWSSQTPILAAWPYHFVQDDPFAEERKRLRIDDECEASIFERLAMDLDERFLETAQVFRENRFAASKTELQNAQVKVDTENGMMYMEFLDSRMIPFGMHATQDALWRSLGRESIRLTDGHYAVSLLVWIRRRWEKREV